MTESAPSSWSLGRDSDVTEVDGQSRVVVIAGILEPIACPVLPFASSMISGYLISLCLSGHNHEIGIIMASFRAVMRIS